MPTPPIPMEALAQTELAETIAESQGGFVNPDSLAAEWLHANLSSAVWTQKADDAPFQKSEFLVAGLATQKDENSGVKHIMVMLEDRFNRQKQPVPLYVLLERFQPVSDLELRDYDS